MTEKKKSSMRPQKQNWEDKRGSREGSQLIGRERRTWADSSRWMATLSMCHEWAFQPRSLSEHPHTYSTYSTYTYGHITHVCSSCARRGGWVLTARLAAPRHTHWSFHSSPPAQKYQSWHRTWAGLGARSVCVCVFSQKQHSNAPHIYQGHTFVTERDKKHEGTTTATSTATTKGFSG